MTIRTVEQLYDILAMELAWRRKELAALRSLIETSSLTLSRRNVLIRAGVTLLYAHWEGFIKVASEAYLEFVAFQRLAYQELSPNFIALAMRRMLNEVGSTGRASTHTAVAEFFLNRLSERSVIPYKTGINTKSNLSSLVLKEITDTLGLDYSEYATKEKMIDERLLKARNNIAYGNYLIIDQSGYLELHEQVIEMMESFRNQIDNRATLKQYRATS